MLSPDELKEHKRRYHNAMDRVDEILTDALCQTYRNVTGKEPSDSLREAFGDAVRFKA